MGKLVSVNHLSYLKGASFARRLGEFSTQQLANMLGCPRLSPGCRNDGWYGELSRLWGLDHANYQNSRFFETVARVPRNGPMTTRWLPVVTGLGWLSPDFGVPGTFKDQWAANFAAEWLRNQVQWCCSRPMSFWQKAHCGADFFRQAHGFMDFGDSKNACISP